MSRFLDKYPIVKYIITAFGIFLLWAIGITATLFGILYLTGLYAKIESLLDLKYNSPFVLVPLFGSLGLAVISFVIGALMYFHKYKRTKVNSIFSKKIKEVLTDK